MNETPEPFGYVYRITNKVNGKTYIGQRMLSKDGNKGWRFYLGSGKLIKAAIEKHGAESFDKELVSLAFSKLELDNIETAAIVDEKMKGHGEYNLFVGASGGDTFSKLAKNDREEVLRRISIGLRSSSKYSDSLELRRVKKKEEMENFAEKNKILLTSIYPLKSMKDIGKELSVSKTFVRNCLVYLNVEISSRNKPGYKHTQEEIGKIRNSINKHNADKVVVLLCNIHSCFNSVSSKNKFCSTECRNAARELVWLAEKDEFCRLWLHENYSVNQMMSHFGCSQRKIYTQIQRFSLPLPSKR